MMEYFARVDRPYRAFEIGHIFTRNNGLVSESPTLTFGFTAEPLNDPAWSDTHFLRLKGDAEALLRSVCGVNVSATPDVRNGLHPGKTAVLMHEGRELAAIGKVDPRLAKAFDVRLPAYICNVYLDNLPEYQTPTYEPPSKYPSTYRDLALVVDLDVSAERITEVAQKAVGELCRGVRVFDEYHTAQIGEGKKSLAVRIVIQRDDATITDEEADAAIARALEALREETGASIRT
jgi:phenylalanyl-tRNA synthetase beta chain